MGDEKKSGKAAKVEEAPVAAKSSPGSSSILGAHLAEVGKTEKDIIETGNLVPQYLGRDLLEKECAEQGVTLKDVATGKATLDTSGIVAAVGVIGHVEVLPVQVSKNDKEKDFSPFSILIRDLRMAVLGFRGNVMKRVDVPVEKAGSILLPITRQTAYNREVMEALRDLENLYLIGAKPVGVEYVNDQASPMVKWKIEIVKLDEKRADRGAQWALPPWYALVANQGHLTDSIRNGEHVGLLHTQFTDGLEVTASGNVHNRVTGEILARIGEGGRVLPPEKQIAPTAAAPS